MASSYALEKPARIAYLEQSKTDLQNVLSQDGIQVALGNRAARLLTLAQGLYVPEVSEEDVVALSDKQVGSNDLPVLALRDDEQVRRDSTFASFTLHHSR